MKKVRLAIGAIGAIGAAPALGLMMPAGNAAAAATHTPASTGKTVVLQDRNAPDYTCTDGVKSSTYGNGMYGAIFYSGGTLCGQSASVGVEKDGLAERVRNWVDGDLVSTKYVTPGTFISGRTVFYSSNTRSAAEVCLAIVKEATLSVEYGPVCLHTLQGET
jgi:hypothetical protein